MAIKGLTQTSSLITIGFSNNESAANTFTQARVDLQLNPLDNEVFVVQAVNMDPIVPDVVPGVSTQVACSLTSTSQTGVQNLSESTCIANTVLDIRTNVALAAASAGVGFSRSSMETPPTDLPYLAIIATNDFFTQIVGSSNANAKAVFGKMYGFRAKASSSIYSALVQSELLSA
jgi:hypothetical protein